MFRAKTLCAVAVSSLLVFLCVSTCAARDDGDPLPQAEIKVVAKRFDFSPKTITVKKGEKVRLAVTAVDVDHGIAISEFDVDVKVPAKQTKIVEFIANREGRFRVFCSVFCGDGHAEMEGELIVNGDQAASVPHMQVKFDESAPGVVIVESGGERLRIDTATRTVTPLTAPSKPEPSAEQRSTPTVVGRERRVSEPYDYRLINVPTPKRVPLHSLNVSFTHRFQQPVRPVDESKGDLLGLDSNSISSFGFSYGITDRLYFNAYRSPMFKTIELGFGYHLLDEAGRSPVALSAYASVEGFDNFQKNFSYNLQAILGRSVTKYVNLFFAPALHLNTNSNGRFNPKPEDFFPTEPLANEIRLGQHTGSFGFGVNARIRPTASLLFEYTPRVGFKLGQVVPLFNQQLGKITGFRNDSEAEIGFGIEKRIGRHSFALTFSNTQMTTTSRYNSSNSGGLVLPPSKFAIGFNLFRRLL